MKHWENCTRSTYVYLTGHNTLGSHDAFAFCPTFMIADHSCFLSVCDWSLYSTNPNAIVKYLKTTRHIRNLRRRHVRWQWKTHIDLHHLRHLQFLKLTKGSPQTGYIQQIQCSGNRGFIIDVQHYPLIKTLDPQQVECVCRRFWYPNTVLLQAHEDKVTANVFGNVWTAMWRFLGTTQNSERFAFTTV